MHRLIDIPLDQLLIEHYLFDSGYSIKQVSEIVDKDEDTVKKIAHDYMRYTMSTRRKL